MFTIQKMIGLTFIIFLFTLLFFEQTDLDIYIQNFFYDFDKHQWLIDERSPMPRLFFYNGIKVVIIIFGVGVLCTWLWSFKNLKLKTYRKKQLLIILSLILIPIIAALGKQTTNVFCPSKLKIYGGDIPHIKLFETMPDYISKKGKCFPAGHASGGFALMSLYFLFKKSRHSYAGLAIGLVTGWIMGIYQMVKGAHFLSHTLATMEIAWIMILVIYGFLFKAWKYPPGHNFQKNDLI